jgi:hypothetical protein
MVRLVEEAYEDRSRTPSSVQWNIAKDAHSFATDLRALCRQQEFPLEEVGRID